MNRPLLLICLGYLIVTLAYSAVNPLFEAPDEHHHYFTAQFIAENGRLPSMADSDEFIKQEAAQPPLYYWLGSWLIRPIDTTNARADLWFNPHVRLGDANAPVNRNHFVHPQATWQGVELAAHILRGFSALFGLGTLCCVFYATQLLTTRNAALLSTGVVAFLPQFNFLHSYVNNDVAVIFFASLVIFQLIRLWITSDKRWITFLLLGLTIGLAILSKTAGILVLAYTLGFLIIFVMVRQQNWRNWLHLPIVTLMSALLVSGWLFWRNWQLYGDVTAANQFVIAAGGPRAVTIWDVFGETSGLWRSLIGVFGWFNIIAPAWIYAIWISLVIFFVFGTIISCVLGRNRRLLLLFLLIGWLFTVYAGMVLFMLQTTAAQGRLLLPALLPISILLSYGIDYWQRKFQHNLFPVVGGLALISLYGLLFVIRPVYATPQTVAKLSTDVVEIGGQPVDNIALIGANLWITQANAGDNVWVDLYWRADELPDEAPEIVLELFGYDEKPRGRIQAYHGGGLYPATLWPVGEIVHTKIGATLDNELNVPTQVRVNVRVVGGGSADLGYIKIPPLPLNNPETKPLAQIGDGIEIIAADFSPKTAQIGTTVTVSVTWRVTQPPNQTLTTFVHLGAGGSPPLAQGDSQPRAGNYPTYWWEAGESFTDTYQFTLHEAVPAGNYPIRIGMYDTTITPLPLRTDEKFPPDRSLTIGEITVDN